MKSPLKGTLEKRNAKVVRLMSVEAVSAKRDAINKKIAEFKAKFKERQASKGKAKKLN